MELDSIFGVIKALSSFNALDAAYRKKFAHDEDKMKHGYTGPGLRPRSAQWILVRELGVPFDDAMVLIGNSK